MCCLVLCSYRVGGLFVVNCISSAGLYVVHLALRCTVVTVCFALSSSLSEAVVVKGGCSELVEWFSVLVILVVGLGETCFTVWSIFKHV